MRLSTFLILLTAHLFAADLFVAPDGLDTNPGNEAAPFKTIQKALDASSPGATVFVKAGVYTELIQFKSSGSGDSAFITLQNFANETPAIDGIGLLPLEGASALLTIADKSFVRVKGIEFRNYSTSKPNNVVAGIRVSGAGTHIELINCHIHHIENNAPVSKNKLGRDAMGISVYGTDGNTPISSLLIDGCEVDHCKLGSSESLTLNGNVDGFKIIRCSVHDNDNIGIDAIGWEGTARNNDQARNGLIAQNNVYNINSKGNPAYGNDSSAGGIYVDGGRDIVIERNAVSRADIGIEIGCEHKGKTASGVIVRDNAVYACVVSGLGFGGYDTKRGLTEYCQFLNNTFYQNDTSKSGTGEIMVQQSRNNLFKQNIVVCSDQNIILTNYFARNKSMQNSFDYNLYLSPGGAEATKWVLSKKELNAFSAWQKSSAQDAHSKFADPLFAGIPPNLKLQPASPARNAGDPAFKPAQSETDFEGKPRLNESAVDIGAFEY